MKADLFYFKQRNYFRFFIAFLLLVISKFSFAWPLFKSELDAYLSHYAGANDQYIKNPSSPKGCFIPTNEEKIKKRWHDLKEQVRQEIGPVSPKPTSSSLLQQNSANTGDDLYKLGYEFVPDFKEIIEFTVAAVPGASHTGYKHILKSKTSIQNKINRDTADNIKDPVKWMGDALRGTIIVDTPDQFRTVIKNLTKIVQQNGHSITYKNIFEQNYKSGYVGVHAILQLSNANKQKILGEIQIHFKDINDGTTQCPKGYTHSLYEITRDLKPNCHGFCKATDQVLINLNNNGNLAQKVVYLFGLNRLITRNAMSKKYANTHNHIVPNDSIVNGISYYFTKGFLLKAALDKNSSILDIQVFDPKNNTWSDHYYNGSNNYKTYMNWIQNEDGDDKEDRGDDSLCISEAVAVEIQKILLAKTKAKTSPVSFFTKFFNWLCKCETRCKTVS